MKNVGIVALACLAVLPSGLGAQDLEARVFELSCAAFPPDLSEADLVSRYGAENVRTQELKWGGEYQGIGTVLFPESQDARLEIIWWNSEDRTRPHDITVRLGHSERWATPNGISVGDSLKDLEALNGRPFRLAGFQTEMSGRVLSWEGGALDPDSEESCMTLSIQPPYDGTEDFALFRQVRWGREYSSGHPAMQGLPLRVAEITIRHDPG